MQTLTPIKRGDTFSFIASFKDPDGNPLTGIALKLKSQIRNKVDALMSELIISETVTLGDYLFRASDTSAFPVNLDLYLDIQYTDNDVVTSSETIILSVEKDVTRNV